MKMTTSYSLGHSGFRPLIRGFFFYPLALADIPIAVLYPFPSPHSGILFLLTVEQIREATKALVSVPLFGDSFFM